MHKVILDTDPGVDDAMALLFLHRHPQIDLIGVTTVFGNAPVEATTRNAVFLKKAFGFAAPVAQGAGRTWNAARVGLEWPTWIHGAGGLGPLMTPQPEAGALDPRDAARFLVDAVHRHPGEVSLVAVGRMTNLAQALRLDPAIAGLVEEVVVMGGAFFNHGNVSPAAEANILGDPEAADLVLTAPWPVTVIGLDVTLKTTMTRRRLKGLVRPGDEAMALLNDISQPYIDFYSGYVDDAMVMHDACACAFVVEPELFRTQSGAIRVVCGGLADGQTILKPDDLRFPPGAWDGHPSQNAALDVDARAVETLIADTLARA